MPYRNRILQALIEMKAGGTANQIHTFLEERKLAAFTMSTTFDYLLTLTEEGVTEAIPVDGSNMRIYRLKSREPLDIMDMVSE